MKFIEDMIEARKEQNDWLEKAINPVLYKMTNYVEDEEPHNLIKSINIILESYLNEKIDDSILEKAMSGVYADTEENKELGRVGQKYGSKTEKEDNVSDKKKQGVTGVNFDYLKRFNLSEEYVNTLVPHMIKNIESTKKFIQNLDKVANKLSEKRDNQSFNEAKNLRNLKIYLLHKMFE